MNKCPECGKILSEDEKILYKCTACGAKIKPDISTQNYNENTIAKALKIISIAILIIGTIGSLVTAFHEVYGETKFSFISFLSSEMVVVIGGVLVLGLREVIRLLQDINNKLK